MSIYDLNAYEVIREEDLSDLKSKGILLKHKKSQAKILLFANDDENKVFTIGFRTPAPDSTGVPHIMEHSVLCGSKNFPVKDPFVELVKGSLNTFLNAMTYPDKTLYPVASTAISLIFPHRAIVSPETGVLFVITISALPMRSAIMGDSS